MDEITIKRMAEDESYRGEFLTEFMAPVGRKWVRDLNVLRQLRHLHEAAGLDAFFEEGDDDEHEF